MSPTMAVVSTWDIPCGIAEYAAYWVDGLHRADPTFKIEIVSDLHPDTVLERPRMPQIVVLNYQAALLSQWHPEHIKQVQLRGGKVLTIWHDSGVPNSDHCKAICAASDAFALHEPFDDLPAHGHYIRHGVPEWEDPIMFEIVRGSQVRNGVWWWDQPIVGSVGMSNGYRNHDLLCKASALAGWGTLIIAPRATDEEVALWTGLNPATVVIREFKPRSEVISYLSGCSATAFLVNTNNAGVSGSIRQGIAARRPVLAIKSRIVRDLWDERAIRWVEDASPAGVAEALLAVPSGRSVDHRVVELAMRDGWTRIGQQFAAILREWL